MYTTMPEGSDVPLTTTQLRQALLPHTAELHLDLQTRRVVHVLRRHELGKVPREQLAEDATEVLVDLLPRLAKGVALLLVELLDGVLDLSLVLDDAVDLLEGLGFALLDAVHGEWSEGQLGDEGGGDTRIKQHQVLRRYPLRLRLQLLLDSLRLLRNIVDIREVIGTARLAERAAQNRQSKTYRKDIANHSLLLLRDPRKLVLELVRITTQRGSLLLHVGRLFLEILELLLKGVRGGPAALDLALDVLDAIVEALECRLLCVEFGLLSLVAFLYRC